MSQVRGSGTRDAKAPIMTDDWRSSSGSLMPHELTAPAIQLLARKGREQPLSATERVELCECVVFHIDAILEKRNIPRVTRPR